MTFVKTQKEILLYRLTKYYGVNLYEIFVRESSNMDANMLVLGVLTKLSAENVIEPSMMRNISEYVSKE